jgi:hypothetical protein
MRSYKMLRMRVDVVWSCMLALVACTIGVGFIWLHYHPIPADVYGSITYNAM